MPERPRRIMVIGAPCSGKSTLARALGAALDLPVHHMDRIHWRPGWDARPLAEKVPMARAVEAGEAWVFEGGLSATYASRAARADLVVMLDLPVTRRLWRMLRRRAAAARGAVRPDLPEDCPERINWEFVHWIVTTARRNRARDLALVAAQPPGKGVVLRGDRASAALVARLAGRA